MSDGLQETIPLVDDLDHEPEVGKEYRVRCVHGKSGVTPIIGVQHNDSAFGFGDFEHVHYDFRFLSDFRISEISKGLGGNEWYADSSLMLMAQQTAINEKVFTYVLTCHRRMNNYPVASCGFMLATLQPAYKDKKATGGVCPHRKVCLSSMPRRGNVVVCPAHGLAWNLKTGNMVKRKIPKNAIPGRVDKEGIEMEKAKMDALDKKGEI